MIMVRVHTVKNVSMRSVELKGQCHEIFDFRFFPLASSTGPLIMCGKIKAWCALWYPLIILGCVCNYNGTVTRTVKEDFISTLCMCAVSLQRF
jgi:hypothetical protein